MSTSIKLIEKEIKDTLSKINSKPDVSLGIRCAELAMQLGMITAYKRAIKILKENEK